MINLVYFYLPAILCCLIVHASAIGTKSNKTVRNFGPFTIVTSSVDNKCDAAISVDEENKCTNNLAVYKLSRTKEEFRGFIVIPKNLVNPGTMVSAEIWRDGGYKPFISKKLKSACEDGVVGSLMKSFLTFGEGCLLMKGNYTVHGIDPDNMVKRLVGNSFFYEKIALGLYWTSKKGAACCVRISCESRPPLKSIKIVKKGTRSDRANRK